MIIVESPRRARFFQKIADIAFGHFGLSGTASVEVVFYSPRNMKELNAHSRAVDAVTDVLSFPYIEGVQPFTRENFPYEYDDSRCAVVIGAITICDKRAREQATLFGHSVKREMGYLFLHGLLHILGFDHINEDDRAKMREQEEAILAKAKLLRNKE